LYFIDLKNLREAAMSNNIVLGLVLGILVLFGMRGVLPDIFISVQPFIVLALVSAGIGGFFIGRYASRRQSQGNP
jgi:hypothetical protein